MRDDGIKHMPIGRVKRRRTCRAQIWTWCGDMLELLATIAAILMIAVPAGIGFGWGLALIGAWL